MGTPENAKAKAKIRGGRRGPREVDEDVTVEIPENVTNESTENVTTEAPIREGRLKPCESFFINFRNFIT